MRYERSVEVLTRSNTRFDRLFSFERIICVSVCESNYNVGGLLLSTLCTVYTGGARVRLTISQKRQSRNRLPKATHVTYASTSLYTTPHKAGVSHTNGKVIQYSDEVSTT